jgi:hypothetical protein
MIGKPSKKEVVSYQLLGFQALRQFPVLVMSYSRATLSLCFHMAHTIASSHRLKVELLKSKVTSSTTKEALPTPIQKRQS